MQICCNTRCNLLTIVQLMQTGTVVINKREWASCIISFSIFFNESFNPRVTVHFWTWNNSCLRISCRFYIFLLFLSIPRNSATFCQVTFCLHFIWNTGVTKSTLCRWLVKTDEFALFQIELRGTLSQSGFLIQLSVAKLLLTPPLLRSRYCICKIINISLCFRILRIGN